MQVFSRFSKNESGATAIEYAIIAGIISGVLIGTFRAMGVQISNMFVPIVNGL